MKYWKIGLLVILVYFVSLFGGFVQDDTVVIVGDEQMGNWNPLAEVWTRPYYYQEIERSIYRPVTSFSFYINALILGKDAWGFRLVNIILYVGVCWLAYLVLKNLFGEKLGYWGALLFAVLPIHTEVVNNIVGRAEMLSLGFVLLSWILFTEKRWSWSMGMLFLGLSSKETAIVGVAIFIYLLLIEKMGERKKEVLVYLVLVLFGFALMRLVALGGWGVGNPATMVENPLKFVSTSERIMTAISLIPFGLGKIVFPMNLSYDYSFNQLKIVDSWQNPMLVIGVLMIIASLLIMGTKKNWRRKELMLGMILFWGPIGVIGNILFPIGTIFGERLWFMSSLGLVILVVDIIAQLKLIRRTEKLLGYLLLGVVSVLAMRTMVRNIDWLSQENLFLHDAVYANQSVLALTNKSAMELLKKDTEGAKLTMEMADKIYPSYPELLNNWGLYYWWTGEKNKAREKFERCLLERPGNGLCSSNLKLMK